jgi:hypothetical protein
LILIAVYTRFSDFMFLIQGSILTLFCKQVSGYKH